MEYDAHHKSHPRRPRLDAEPKLGSHDRQPKLGSHRQ
jgi:hypothetical protein